MLTTTTIDILDGTIRNASALRVDMDGNGTTDFSLTPRVGDVVFPDLTPPEARISFSTSTQSLLVEGLDEISSVTVVTTATSSVITDTAGNTLQILFSLKQEKHQIKFQIHELIYNNVSSGKIPKNTLQYEWSVNKDGIIKKLEEKSTVGDVKIEGHYDAKRNVTRIKKKYKDDEEKVEETFAGSVIVGAMTEKGNINVSY